MKHVVRNYTFNPSAKTLTFNRPEFGNNVDLTRLLLITDVTTGQILYQFNGGGVSVSGNVLTFVSLPSGVQASDALQILYDFPQPEETRRTSPDTNIVFDDRFDDGFCGWVEYNPPASWSLGQMPLTLGTDGVFGRYALRLTTANVANTSHAGTSSAMKRGTHHAQPAAVNKGIVKAEYWFTYGSDGTSATSSWNVTAATYAQVNSIWYVTLTMSGTALQYITTGTWIIVSGVGGITAANASAIASSVDTNAGTITYPVASAPSGAYTSGGLVQFKRDLAAPRSISFQVDSQTNVDGTSNKARTAGQRTHWIAAWLNSDQSGGAPYPSGQWLISQGSGLAFGAAGYTSPDNTALCYTGYYSDFCQNQNLRNLMYVALVMDTRTGNWLGLQANDQYMDLTQIPSLSGAASPPVLSTLDASYNLTDFNGGLNQYIQINNLTTGGVGATYATAAWLEMHRTRMSYL